MNPLRAKRQYLRDESRKYGEDLVAVAESEWPKSWAGIETQSPVAVWRNRKFLVILWLENGRRRLSMQRTELDGEGRWRDGITWDEIQALKSQCGFGDVQGIEFYPPDRDLVNVANLRHIWLMDEPLPFMWSDRTK